MPWRSCSLSNIWYAKLAETFFLLLNYMCISMRLSCWSGKYDVMQQPKNISEVSKRTICFYMFLDEETEAYIKNSSIVDSRQRVGLWRIVVVRNLPYEDARRNGKVYCYFPFFLIQPIFVA